MQKQLQEKGNRIIRTVAVLLAVMLLVAAAVTGGVSGQAASATSITEVDLDSFSVDFDYNGTLVKSLTIESIQKTGTYFTNNGLKTADLTYNGTAYTYYTLPTSKNSNAYITFSQVFSYTDSDGNTELLDVKIYFWAPKSTTSSDIGVLALNNALGRVAFSSQNYMDKNGSDADESFVDTEWHFYKAGTSTEVSVGGIMYFTDNDTDEGRAGWRGRNSGRAGNWQ